MSLLSRMLLREMAIPFLFSFCALSVLLLLGSLLPLLEPMLRAGIKFTELGKIAILLLPTFWAFVLPMATLLGILLGFLRLSRDSEMLALFACGAGLKKLIIPVIMVSITTCLFSFFLSASVIPKAKTSSRNFIRELTERSLARGIPEKIFFSPMSKLTLYVDKSLDQGHRFKGVYIQDARKEQVTYQIMAREGELFAQPGGLEVGLRLSNGTLNRISDDYRKTDTLDFKSYALRLSLPGKDRKQKRGELGLGSLLKAASDPDTSARHKVHFLTEFHERLAVPVGALILGIMAAPLGILFGRTGLSGGIALGLAAFLLYYLSMAFAASLADTGNISPVIALWVPNLIFAGITVGLIILLNKQGPLRN
ncbi:MAG: LptF/LptG family permease [Deltaproteobacteria bacterium]|nr:LptF/LptG family permease [Deltaproteobacteria bacterium]MBW1965551.1 LptF/LptG family permease [Deltaproteobacteria bacterium]MBW2081294.1 LptF/LptG family permease [Deltaproteobacteria bacterium]